MDGNHVKDMLVIENRNYTKILREHLVSYRC